MPESGQAALPDRATPTAADAAEAIDPNPPEVGRGLVGAPDGVAASCLISLPYPIFHNLLDFLTR